MKPNSYLIHERDIIGKIQASIAGISPLFINNIISIDPLNGAKPKEIWLCIGGEAVVRRLCGVATQVQGYLCGDSMSDSYIGNVNGAEATILAMQHTTLVCFRVAKTSSLIDLGQRRWGSSRDVQAKGRHVWCFYLSEEACMAVVASSCAARREG